MWLVSVALVWTRYSGRRQILVRDLGLKLHNGWVGVLLSSVPDDKQDKNVSQTYQASAYNRA